MDTRKLMHFIEVVDQGSISKAAEKLGLSQPAVTKSLRMLEADLDVKLLVRSSSGVTMTEYGRSLYAHARAVVAEIEHAQSEIRRLNGGDIAYVRVGVLPSVSSVLVARAVANLTSRDRGSSIRLRISEQPQYELMPALRRREYDFVVAMVDRFEPDAALRHRIILQDQLRIVARVGHPLDGLERVTCADLVKYPWIHPVVGTTHRPVLAQLFKGSGIQPPLAQIECASIQHVKTVMIASDALGLMPSHTIEPELRANALCCLPIISDDLRRTIGIYYSTHRPLNPAAQIVMREIERVCSGLPKQNWDPFAGIMMSRNQGDDDSVGRRPD